MGVWGLCPQWGPGGPGGFAPQKLNGFFYSYWLNFYITWQILKFNRCAVTTIDNAAKDRAKINNY